MSQVVVHYVLVHRGSSGLFDFFCKIVNVFYSPIIRLANIELQDVETVSVSFTLQPRRVNFTRTAYTGQTINTSLIGYLGRIRN